MSDLKVKGEWRDVDNISVYEARAISQTGRIIAKVAIQVYTGLPVMEQSYSSVMRDVENIAKEEVLKISDKLPRTITHPPTT